jgi:hypothetical protein
MLASFQRAASKQIHSWQERQGTQLAGETRYTAGRRDKQGTQLARETRYTAGRRDKVHSWQERQGTQLAGERATRQE